MKSRTRRLLALAPVAVAAALLAADRLVVACARDGRFHGLWMPPFGEQSAPERQAALRERVEELRAGHAPAPLLAFHPHYGWVNRPGSYTTRGVEQHIDALGARGRRERSATPAPGTTRVACFGASYTFGAEVLDGEDWPTQLEALAPGVEALNLGVGGWGTDQALLRWRAEGPALEPSVVLLGLHLEHIRLNVNRFRPLVYPWHDTITVKPRFVLADGELAFVPVPYATRLEMFEAALDGRLREELRRGDWWGCFDPTPRWSGLAAFACAVSHARRREPQWLWTHPREEPYRVTLALLQAFHDETRAAGVERAAVILFAGLEDVELRRAGRAYWGGLTRDLDARGIPYIDVSETLAARPDLESLYEAGTHLSPAGNRVVAERVAGWLRGE